MWTWGEMRLASPEELARHPALSAMGPEPFSEEWTPEHFSEGLARRPKTAIKAILLDQGLVPELATFMQMSHCTGRVSIPSVQRLR